jgi:hypothetical protein
MFVFFSVHLYQSKAQNASMFDDASLQLLLQRIPPTRDVCFLALHL